MLGLTSVTFRQLSAMDIIALAEEAGLDGIEWGGDVHVAPGAYKEAQDIGEATRKAGLQVLSYGSYFKAGVSELSEIEPIIRTAKLLGASMIRVWAGNKGPHEAGPEYRTKVIQSLQAFVAAAAEAGITVSTEYHRGTLTMTGESAVQLMEEVPGLKTYWQPNPDITEADNKRELQMIRPWLTNIHVFQWEGTPVSTRYPLEQGERIWSEYLELVPEQKTQYHRIMEFVMNDDPDQFLKDADFLKKLSR